MLLVLLLIPLVLCAVLVIHALELRSEHTVESAPLEKLEGEWTYESKLVEDLDLYDVLSLDPSKFLIVGHRIRVIDTHRAHLTGGVRWEFTIIAKVRKITLLDKLQRKK